jgi:rifampin ADP-ribosylating transferase
MAHTSEGPFVVSEPCPVRHGQGTIIEQPCSRCHGTGVQRFHHGTKAGLKPGDLIEPGRTSNFGKRNRTVYIYLTGTLDAAARGAELALGEGPGRIYMVEPTGPIMDDPNLTDKKFPGNPTKAYRSREPLRVTGDVTDWQGHSLETIQAMKDAIKGLEPIDD